MNELWFHHFLLQRYILYIIHYIIPFTENESEKTSKKLIKNKNKIEVNNETVDPNEASSKP